MRPLPDTKAQRRRRRRRRRKVVRPAAIENGVGELRDALALSGFAPAGLAQWFTTVKNWSPPRTCEPYKQHARSAIGVWCPHRNIIQHRYERTRTRLNGVGFGALFGQFGTTHDMFYCCHRIVLCVNPGRALLNGIHTVMSAFYLLNRLLTI